VEFLRSGLKHIPHSDLFLRALDHLIFCGFAKGLGSVPNSCAGFRAGNGIVEDEKTRQNLKKKKNYQ
jgi:hypothetical protein